MDDIESTAMELGEQFGPVDLQELVKYLKFIAFGMDRALPANGEAKTLQPAKAPAASKAKAAKVTTDDEPF